MAVVLGTGYRGRGVLEVASAICDRHGVEEIVAMEPAQLRRLKGIGRVKAGVLVAAFELARRGLHKGLGVQPIVSCPADTLPLLTELKASGASTSCASISTPATRWSTRR